MKFLRVVSAVMCTVIVIGAVGYLLTLGIVGLTEDAMPWQVLGQMPAANEAMLGMTKLGAGPFAAEHYRIDASQSKFMAHAIRGGLLFFKGHDHLVAVREFTGEARLDPNVIANSSLQIIAKTASMEETSSAFTDAQKKIINKELREI